MRILRNILLILVVIIVILVAAGALLIVNWTRGPLPQHNGEIQVDGLIDSVEIYRDEWGVPHIYAKNAHDLFFAQGYTQAQDRWWQMEFSRHIGRGSIQELTGQNEDVMRSDVFIRKMGWQRAAERDVAKANPEMLEHLQSFSDGVNAYITTRPSGALAFEYNLLGITGVKIPIEPWTVLDSQVWAKAMAWDLSGNQSDELFISDLLDELDESMVNDFAPEYPFGEKITILFPEDIPLNDASTAHNGLVTDIAGIRGLSSADAEEIALLPQDAGIGSNNWVVAGSKSESGMPLLANDPHLSIQMPSIWYEIGLHCRPVTEDCPFDVVGFAFPADPAVIIGHNAYIAWGVTNVGWDTQDYYLIKVNPENELQYEFNGEWVDIEVVEEIIKYGDGGETTIQVRLTRYGPIMNDNVVREDGTLSGFNNENPRAIRWTALESGTIFEAILELNKAQNWEDFRNAARLWDTPSQNMIYADLEGNIGYQTPGLIPVRAAGHTGLLPVDGSTDANDWLGFVPFDELPRIYNPERGFIATANQALVPLEFYDQLKEKLGGEYGQNAHYIFGYQWDYGYRGQRIVDMLEATDKHNLESFRKIHGDNQIGIAVELAPFLEGLDMGSNELNSARDWMLEWDFQMHMDSPQAALFAMFWGVTVDNLYNDQLGDACCENGGSQNMWATARLLNDPENAWWDYAETDEVETRDDILIRSFREAYSYTSDILGADPSKWKWGDLHTSTFVSNPLGLSGIDLVEDMVNSGPVATSGGPSIVNATGWNAASGGDFSVSSLPSMRMVVDLSDFSKSVTIHTTGQSGHPFSDHYNDMTDMWRNIEYKPMLWTDEQVKATAKNTLTLRPK